MKQWVRLALSLVASAVMLWLAFHKVDFVRVWELLCTVSLPAIGIFVATLIIIQIARCLRWGTLVKPFAPLPLSAVFRVANVGMLMILVLPLRLGEFVRPLMMKREGGTSFSATMGAVVVERAVDGLLVSLLFFVSTLTTPNVPAALVAAAYLSLLIFASAMVCAIGMLVARERMLKLVEWLARLVSDKLAHRAVGMLGAFADGVRALPDRRSLSIVIGWTLVYWAASGLGYYCVFRAFGWAVPLTAGFTLVSVLVIAIMIPAGPGFLGTFQAGVVAALAIYGIGVNEAAAYGLIIYLLGSAVTLGFGLPYLFTPKARIADIVHAAPEPL